MIKGNNFEHIAQEIIHLQQRMAALRAENTDLRQQLSNLRSGRTILVEIAGKRFSFSVDATEAPAQNAVDATEAPAQNAVDAPKAPAQEATTTPALPEQPSTPPIQLEPSSSISSTVEVPQDYPTTPRIKALQDEEKDDAEEKNRARPSTFLEEIMLDEFAAAASTPLAVWTGPLKKPEPISEDQKEALRRELMGSFLLE
ncbi:MAG TPA: hypothetical protein VL485_12225 [Ktedonobacteraceae bacterium]|nr:hypothetical protein [Ktedonobacteraceae bacterium]